MQASYPQQIIVTIVVSMVKKSESKNDTRKIENEKYSVVGNSAYFDENVNKGQEKMSHQYQESTYGDNSSTILRHGKWSYFDV